MFVVPELYVIPGQISNSFKISKVLILCHLLIEQGVDLMIGVNDWLSSKVDRLTIFNSDYWLHTKVNIVEGKCFNI